MDVELTALEEKLAALLADYDRLRADSDSLRRELANAQERNAALGSRMRAATQRLDHLLDALPQESN
jgi:chromosome segregation ATPase